MRNGYRLAVALVTAGLIGASFLLEKKLHKNLPPESPKGIIDEVWQIIRRQYVDDTFNQVDWRAVRSEYIERSYSNKEEAYKAIREMLAKLEDPYTYFMNPDEFKNIQVKTSREARIQTHPVSTRTEESPIGKIGYIRLTQFNAQASKEMLETIKDLEGKNVEGYILDLRSNPGGLLSSSIEISRMWIEEGTIVSTVNRLGTVNILKANNTALTDKPLTVLVDGGSAAASEIVSGALQDHNRATLVGITTFGNGLLQSVRGLGDGSVLVVTIAKYFTPSGRDINKEGIPPDVELELSEEQRKELQRDRTQIGTADDPQFVKALDVLIQEIIAKRGR